MKIRVILLILTIFLVMSCNDDKTCKNECQKDAVRCNIDNKAIETCTVQDNECTIWVSKDCTDNKICTKTDESTYTCEDTFCKAGEKRCKNDNIETCKKDGSKWVVTTCETPLKCDESDFTCKELEVICNANEKRCKNDNVEICKNDGSAWETTTCKSPKKCDPEDFTCKEIICTPNERRCVNDNRETCKADGSGWETLYCTATNRKCDPISNDCETCLEGDKRCFSGNIEICNSENNWEALTTCNTPKQCNYSTFTCENDIKPFIFKVKVDDISKPVEIEGSTMTQIEEEVYFFNFLYNVDCDNDGVFEAKDQTETYACNYTTVGVHTISIYGKFPYLSLGFDYKNKLISIEQWGDIQWESMKDMCSSENFILNATDNPNLSQVKDMSSMFKMAKNFNSDISSWNVSNVTNMNNMFASANSFNQDLSSWDVSNVTDFSFMFQAATNFNKDISSWNTSSAKDMQAMFNLTQHFNQNISSWNVSNVTNMSYMFSGGFGVNTVFNQDLSSWDVNNVTSCSIFENGNTWILPKPNFTQCSY